MKLKPDERFFKYQKNFFLNSINSLPPKLETDLSFNNHEENYHYLSPSPKKSKMYNNNLDGNNLNSRECNPYIKSQISETRMNSGYSNSLTNLNNYNNDGKNKKYVI